MRYALSVILFCSAAWGLTAQVGDHLRLMPGDTLYRAIDVLPDIQGPEVRNGETFWNYGRLLTPFVHKVLVRTPGRIRTQCRIAPDVVYTGMDKVDYYLYHDDDGIWISAMRFTAAGRHWLARTADKIPWRIGMPGPTDLLEYNGAIELIPYGAQGFSNEDLNPNDISEKFYLLFNVSITGSGSEGTIQLPRLRYRVYELTSIFDAAVDRYVKKVEGSWEEVNPGSAALELPRALSSHIDVFYWSEDHADPIVVENQDLTSDESGAVEFRILPYGVPEYPGRISNEDIFVYPNPSYGQVRFDFVNLEKGDYSLEIYNILGVKLRSETVQIDGDATLQYDFSELGKGTYVYRLVDPYLHTIRSKRLVIVEP